MKLKASLHIHTAEDRQDGHMIPYDAYQLIDEAAAKGFRVLGYTPHQKFVFKEEFAAYARQKGILLIPGVERDLGRVLNKHVIILNCDKSIEQVTNFKQLAQYKKAHPEIFVIAPHPTYNRAISMGARYLKRYIGLFDAVEHSWIYTLKWDSNRPAMRIARQHNKPVVATADVHEIKKLTNDHIIVEVDELSAEAVFKAIRSRTYENVTFPETMFHLAGYLGAMYVRYVLKYVSVKMLGFRPKRLAVARVR